MSERAEILDKFGRFDFGFDFGGPVKTPESPASYGENDSVLRNTVAPRFQPVDAETLYSDAHGYGWASAGERTSEAIPLAPYLEVRAVKMSPVNLPHDVLYRDFIRGKGTQIFRVKATPGEYKVHILHPDRSDTITDWRTDGEFLDIRFPEGEWSVSGLVIQGPRSKVPLDPQVFPKLLPRPAITHHPTMSAIEGEPIALKIRIAPQTNVTRIRLHYRPLNQKAQFKTIENTAGQQSFTIPGEDISANWDLMYYFEILNQGGSGWFHPNPQAGTVMRE